MSVLTYLFKKYPQLSMHLYLLGAVIFWGISWPAGKVVAQSVPPLHAAMWRFMMACVVLLAWLVISNKGLPRLTLKQSLGMILGGFIGVFGYAYCFMAGLATVSASRASLVIAFNPVLTTLLAAVLFREPLNLKINLGMVFALLGGVVVLSKGHPASLLDGVLGTGELLLLGCVVTWSLYCLLGKKLMDGIPALTNITYSSCAGLVFLSSAAFLFESQAPLSLPAESLSLWSHTSTVLSMIVFLSLGATVLAYVWYFKGIAVLGAGAAASYNSLVPIFGVLSSMLYLGEAADSSLWLGGFLTIVGVGLMNYARSSLKH
jgi:drug/metabolite transporter (DMT)-like permease